MYFILKPSTCIEKWWSIIQAFTVLLPLKLYKYSYLDERLFSLDEIDEDILLIQDKKGEFHAIEAICSHEGGPLDQGDIEELGDKLLIICPWHSFDFDLKTGNSSTGLRVSYKMTKLKIIIFETF